MLYGLYLSAYGADVESTRLDVISNNLANAQTTGFKRDLALFQAHQPYDVENGGAGEPPGNLNDSTGGISLAGIVTDFSDGQLQQTHAPLDVALHGPGFLHVSDGQQKFLTRNGHLSLNRSGQLVTQDQGLRVLNSSGSPITLSPAATGFEIARDGSVVQSFEDGTRAFAGRLAVVQPESPELLQKVGANLYTTDKEVRQAPPGAVDVNQGYLESSGTQPVTEMLNMIQASRNFESNLNMIKYQDESLGRLLQTLPRR